MTEFDVDWSLRRVLGTWIHAYVSSKISRVVDLYDHHVDLSIPEAGEDMYKFYTFVVKIEDILSDENYIKYTDMMPLVDSLIFEIPMSEQAALISWKYLRILCRLIYLFNRMKLNMETFQQVLVKHTPEIIRSIETLQIENPRLRSLHAVLGKSSPLAKTTKVRESLIALVHNSANDNGMNDLFNLSQRHSFVFVSSVIDNAKEIFQPICHFLTIKDSPSLNIIDLMREKIPEAILRQTLWKNIEASPMKEVHFSDVEWSRKREQETGAIAWEFIVRILANEYSDLTVPSSIMDVLNEGNSENLNRLSLLPMRKKLKTSSGNDKPVPVHSIKAVCALLLMSSRTLINCSCSSKTSAFVDKILASHGVSEQTKKSIVKARLIAFAAHEMTKFPIVRPYERYNFRNIFSSYSISSIFDRASNQPFKPATLNEISLVHAVSLGGLEIDSSSMIYLLMSVKRGNANINDSLYRELHDAINSTYEISDVSYDHNDDKVFDDLRGNLNAHVTERKSNYTESLIFCLAFVFRMAYFTNIDVKAVHFIPFIRLLDIIIVKEKSPVTKVCFELFLDNFKLPGSSVKNMTSLHLDNVHVDVRGIFKYLLLILNVQLVESTSPPLTLVDFIEHTKKITLYK
uniref:IVSP3-1-like protein n=1 Tax=Glypta fumiferanae TaxID=389681 RepID=A0A0F6Q753_9HYME|nr:IVSP3-1-like protein [Glypta fumiferanae]